LLLGFVLPGLLLLCVTYSMLVYYRLVSIARQSTKPSGKRSAAAEFSGCRRKIPLLFREKVQKQFVRFVHFKIGLLNGRAASV